MNSETGHRVRAKWFALAAAIVVASVLWFALGRSSRGDHVASGIGAVASTRDASSTNDATAAPDAKPPTIETRTRRVVASDASTLPPTGTPLKNIFADLQSRASAGDAAAATRLFKDLSTCRNAETVSTNVSQMVKQNLAQSTAGMTPEQIGNMEQSLAQMQQMLDKAKESQPMCDGIDKTQYEQILPITLRAAQLGDNKAAECYADGRLLFGHALLDHPEWLADYKRNALPMVEQAMTRGDWPAVQMLASAYEGNNHFTPFTTVTAADDAKRYQYLKLLQLGSTTVSPNQSNEIEGLAASLDSSSVATGDAWAQDAYQKYFGGTTMQANADLAGCGDRVY